jgi:hypothetical protein
MKKCILLFLLMPLVQFAAEISLETQMRNLSLAGQQDQIHILSNQLAELEEKLCEYHFQSATFERGKKHPSLFSFRSLKDLVDIGNKHPESLQRKADYFTKALQKRKSIVFYYKLSADRAFKPLHKNAKLIQTVQQYLRTQNSLLEALDKASPIDLKL